MSRTWAKVLVMAENLMMYVGKERVVVDLSNLMTKENISVFEKVPYEIASKSKEFIAALETAYADCTDIELDIDNAEKYTEVIVTLINLIEEDEDMPTNNSKEEKKMAGVKNSMKVAVEEMMGKIVEAKDNIKVNAGETKEEYIERVDDSLNVMKGALGGVLNTLDGALGFTVLKDNILDIIESGTVGKSSKKDLFKMAKRCRELIELEIENLEIWGDEEQFAKATTLKALVEGERGKSIFEAFVTGCIWIGKKVARKLRKWCHIDDEKSIIGAICSSIAGFVGVVREGVKLVWNTVKFAVSFVVAGVIKAIDSIYRAISTFVKGVKTWISKQYEKLANKDTAEDPVDDEIVEAEVKALVEEFYEEN